MTDTRLASWIALQDTISEKRFRVLTKIKDHEGLACFQIASLLSVPFHHVSGRLTELRDMKMISDSGIRRVNPTSEKEQIVWTWTGSFSPVPLKKKTKDMIIKDLETKLVVRDNQLRRVIRALKEVRV